MPDLFYFDGFLEIGRMYAFRHSIFPNILYNRTIINHDRGVRMSPVNNETRKKQTATMIFNILIMVASFTIALIALPQEIFFVVGVIILFALREIEKEVDRTNPRRFSILSNGK